MTETAQEATETDYSATLFLPKTEFPMRAGLPAREPDWLKRWEDMNLFERLREQSADKPKFTLHDGPPYANGNIHIGHALNKILKDLVVRSKQMLGNNSAYVPGWDCHGLPIEWKIEEQYRAKGKNKDEVPINEFRKECRTFAEHWVDVQRQEFKRLGVIGDWDNPYLTMSYDAEAVIVGELHKFAMTGQLYRGSKPVMWSVVERTALAEAEIEYQDYESDTIWVKFPVREAADVFDVSRDNSPSMSPPDERAEMLDASVVIWTTTPWTIPGNRAISFSSRIAYGLYEVESAENEFGPQPGEKLVFAQALTEASEQKAKIKLRKIRNVSADELAHILCDHPLKGLGGGYDFAIPLLDGEHVTDDAGTGFVHTAPSHGADDYEIWTKFASSKLRANSVERVHGNPIVFDAQQATFTLLGRPFDTAIPFPVDDAGFYTKDAPGFDANAEGGAARVIDDKGNKGDANKRVIQALIDANALFARGRLKHQYPHSWRSKKPIIFRNTPQWFVHMDKDLGGVVFDASSGAALKAPSPGAAAPTSPPKGEVRNGDATASPLPSGERSSPAQQGMGEGALPDTLRTRALAAIDKTRFVPPAGQNRLHSMIAERPDWVLSRQRAWGVPIAVFRNETTGEIIPGPDFKRSEELRQRIVTAFEAEGADAWFADGAKERFLTGLVDDPDAWTQVRDILDVWFDSGSTHAFCLRNKQKWPHLKFPASMYLEGSDQHRGWFHSSLLESCGTNGFAPYDSVLTHGFTMDKDGMKMSKSLGNTIAPQDIIKQYGADILRLWVATIDYSEDHRIGDEILKNVVENYRKLRNSIRWMLGNLAHFRPEDAVAPADMPELERLMLSRLAGLDAVVRETYDNYDYKRAISALSTFMNIDLSAFYFDIRKDALYCDPISSVRRRAALTVLDRLFNHLVVWLAPVLSFTAEEAWLERNPGDDVSVHLELFPEVPADWKDDDLEAKWALIRRVRRVVTGALEIERRDKTIGSSLEAAPKVHIADADLVVALHGQDFAEICITSGIEVIQNEGPSEAFRLDDVPGVSVVFARAGGRRCARSWKVSEDVGSDPDYPDLSPRDATAMRERAAAGL
ncbi:MAG: isoleucine--tRNA ligase [Alphaproteobacteria bacterium]|nr:isoleucine--tRNA ligase [Alphaproteobacteria bacterium]